MSVSGGMTREGEQSSRRRTHGPEPMRSASPSHSASLPSRWQQALGNRGLQLLLKSANTRPVATAAEHVAHPTHAAEQEAQRVSEAIASTPDTAAGQRSAPAAFSPGGGSLAGGDHLTHAGPGQELDRAARSEFEAQFGRDFGDVRVHHGQDAAASAGARAAGAYTVGRNIVFSQGAFSPLTLAGRRLLAHELTHVVQQSGGGAWRSQGVAQQISGSPVGVALAPNAASVAKLSTDLQTVIDGAVWKEIRKRVYPKESAAGIKRAKERKLGKQADLTGLGKLTTLAHFAAAIKSLQGKWGPPRSPADRVQAVGLAINAELTSAGVPPFAFVRAQKMDWKGFFRPSAWAFFISEDLVNNAALSDADAAEVTNTALHEARHAEQDFLAARFAAGPPQNLTAAQIAATHHIPQAPVANAAVAAKFDAKTDAKVVALGRAMHQATVTDAAANQQITNDDFTTEMADARKEAIASLAALKATATDATVADATAKKAKLEAAIVEVERRYTLYRNIPYEADAHEVGDAAEQAFKGWP